MTQIFKLALPSGVGLKVSCHLCHYCSASTVTETRMEMYNSEWSVSWHFSWRTPLCSVFLSNWWSFRWSSNFLVLQDPKIHVHKKPSIAPCPEPTAYFPSWLDQLYCNLNNAWWFVSVQLFNTNFKFTRTSIIYSTNFRPTSVTPLF